MDDLIERAKAELISYAREEYGRAGIKTPEGGITHRALKATISELVDDTYQPGMSYEHLLGLCKYEIKLDPNSVTGEKAQ